MPKRPRNAQDERQRRLSPEQVDDVRLAVAEADRGDFATEEKMAAFWKKCGL
jgi:predicted transcriptional regulator